jgi:hypothetical protein
MSWWTPRAVGPLARPIAVGLSAGPVDQRRRTFRAARVRPRCATAVVAALAAVWLAAPATSHATAVTDWNAVAASTLAAIPGPAGGAPPASQINLAMVQGAVYDAVVAIEPRYRPYLLRARFGRGASQDAAVATAAHRVLIDILSSVPATIAFPNRDPSIATVDVEYATRLAAIADGASKDAGIAAGNAAAEAMIAARQGDGRFGPSPWVSDPTAGHWQPLLNPDGSPMLDPTPWVGGVRPFVIRSATQFQTDGPNPLTSAAYAADVNEVKALGAVDSTVRTPEQTHIALFWQTNPAVIWNAVARDLADRPGTALDTVDAARLFALLDLSSADSLITAWHDKYYWDFWRPWQAIRRADEDGNPLTAADPTWTPLITAPYPEHPSGHLSLDGASLRVLQRVFGTDELRFDVASARFPGETRTYDRFSQPLKEIIEARIWAGLHFRTADDQAQALGRKVAHFVARHALQARGCGHRGRSHQHNRPHRRR